MRYTTIACVGLMIFLPEILLAQYRTKPRRPLDIKKISVDDLSRGRGGFGGFQPQGLAGLESSPYSGKWMRIEVQYGSHLKFSDEITLAFYVLTRGGAILKGQITQMNIFEGPRHHAAVFLHPTTVQRFGPVERVMVELRHQGIVIDASQWPAGTRREWWKEIPPREGYLKTIFQTPFLLDQPDRYEDTIMKTQ